MFYWFFAFPSKVGPFRPKLHRVLSITILITQLVEYVSSIFFCCSFFNVELVKFKTRLCFIAECMLFYRNVHASLEIIYFSLPLSVLALSLVSLCFRAHTGERHSDRLPSFHWKCIQMTQSDLRRLPSVYLQLMKLRF